jgi:hypothetical protein
LRGQRQHRQVAALFDFLQAFHDLEAVQAGHLQIQQDQVVAMLAVQRAYLFRQHGRGHIGIAGLTQDLQHQIDVVSAVIHYQDFGVKDLVSARHDGLCLFNS